MIRTATLLVVSASILFHSDVNAEIYKCVKDGKTSFTDKPCEEGQNGTQLNLSVNASPSSQSSNGVPSPWLAGYSGYIDALEISKKLNVPIMIYFKADWCRYCKKLERELLHTASGKEALKDVIKVRIKPEENVDNDRFFRELGGRGYPTILVQESHNSKPSKRYLMTKDSGVWKTRGADYLAKLMEFE